MYFLPTSVRSRYCRLKHAPLSRLPLYYLWWTEEDARMRTRYRRTYHLVSGRLMKAGWDCCIQGFTRGWRNTRRRGGYIYPSRLQVSRWIRKLSSSNEINISSRQLRATNSFIVNTVNIVHLARLNQSLGCSGHKGWRNLRPTLMFHSPGWICGCIQTLSHDPDCYFSALVFQNKMNMKEYYKCMLTHWHTVATYWGHLNRAIMWRRKGHRRTGKSIYDGSVPFRCSLLEKHSYSFPSHMWLVE